MDVFKKRKENQIYEQYEQTKIVYIRNDSIRFYKNSVFFS